MQRRIQPLGDNLSSFVRASKCINSFHAAVEEVILNCIDASSRSISVYIDFHSSSFEVYDDGNGIDASCLEVNVAEWNRTSKQNSALSEFDGGETQEDSTYGMKGEALASLRHLSNMCIESRPRKSTTADHANTVCMKNMQHGSPVEFYSIEPTDRSRLSARWNRTYSTGVQVYNLFHNLPVRQKAMKPDTERSLIKEFIQHMSVLHHNISWTLFEVNLSDNLQHDTHELVLLRLPSQVSVAKRFLHIHGVENMLNMQEISHASRGFTLQGFITPPISEYCTKHREGQYLYLNSRWLRGSDCMSSAINSVYSRVITAVSGGNPGGMVARHASYNNIATMESSSNSGNNNNITDSNAAKQVNAYPYFVLHLTCPTSAYDILSEPDKSVVVFRNEVHALEVIEEVCSALIRQHYSDRVDSLLPLVPVNPLVRATMAITTAAATVPSVHDTALSTTATSSEEDSEPYRAEASYYNIQNNSATTKRTSFDAPYFTSPPVVKASSGYTQDTHSPYFTTNHKLENRGNPTVYAKLDVIAATINTTTATAKATNSSPHSDLFQSAFFNNTTTATTIDNTLSPTRTLSASTLFRDSPDATKPTAYAAQPQHYIHTNSNILPALTHYDSPYQCNVTATAAAHLQHSGVKRMITSITEPMIHHNGNHTSDTGNCTTFQHNSSNSKELSTKKVKYPMGNGSSSFDEMFVPNEAILLQSDEHIGDSKFGDDLTAEDNGTYTTYSDGSETSTDKHPPYSAYRNTDNVYRSNRDETSEAYCVSSGEHIMTDIAFADQETDPVDASNGSCNINDTSGGTLDGTNDIAGNSDGGGDIREHNYYDTDVYTGDDSPYSAAGSGEVQGATTDTSTNAAYVASRLATPGYVQHSLRDTVNHATTTTITNNDTTATVPDVAATTALPSALPNVLLTQPVLSKHSAHTEMSLNKVALQAHLQCIGQCDIRYIVATSCVCNNSDTRYTSGDGDTNDSSDVKTQRCSKCNNASLLLLLDQHAVDERIQVEALAQAVTQARADAIDTTGKGYLLATNNSAYYTTTTSTECLTLTTREADIVKSRQQVLQDWGFTYTLHNTNVHNNNTSNSSFNHNTSQSIITTLQLHTVPCIATEPLHASDLREFLHYLSSYRELPSSLLTPPVVSRIVASRACHSAVRFGDALSSNKCVQLCQQLMHTELPFQCAHGRPSMAPLLDLRGLHEYKRQGLNAAAALEVWNL